MGDAERKRLVYVAATRARDHLVVSLHRADHNGGTTAAELLHPVAPPDEALASRFAAAADTGLAGLPPRQVTPPAESHDALHGRLTHARTLSSNPPSTSASGLEGNEPEVALAVAGEEDEPSLTAPPILAKAPRDLDTPSYNKGRDATAIGTAVHAVLQTIDLRTGAGLDALADMQCLAGGIPQHLDLVKDLVRRALASDAVQTAAVNQYWRESFLAMTTQDGEIIEGYADLIFRTPEGQLVVVAYKTDQIRSAEDLAERSEFYSPQLGAYANIIREASGIEPTAVPLFLDASP